MGHRWSSFPLKKEGNQNIEDEPLNEDDLKNEDEAKNEDNWKKEDYAKNEDDLENNTVLILIPNINRGFIGQSLVKG